MPMDDMWDWPLLLYVGTVILKRSDRAFWRMTPRKLNALVRAHIFFNGGDDDKNSGKSSRQPQPEYGFIDNVIF